MKLIYRLFFFSVLFAASLQSEDLLDLEEFPQEFVLETKQIRIAGYPDAFNPSIIRWEGRLLLSFRFIPDLKQKFVSRIGLIGLDEEFNPIGDPEILSFREEDSSIPARIDDLRLIEVAGKLYIVYADNHHTVLTRGGFRVYVAELVSSEKGFLVKGIECLSDFPGENPNRREKNWTPFDYKGSLCLAYSIMPHIIFYLVNGESRCECVASTDFSVEWPWGELRGGTSGILDEGEYIAFFHSSTLMPSIHSEGSDILHYFMGAYTFSAEPPFAITRISPEPIFGKGFYSGMSYTPYWKPVKVVFPCGFVLDKNYVWISYGRDDHECWIVKLNKRELINSLHPVESRISRHCWDEPNS